MKKIGILDGQTIQGLIVAKQLSKAGYQVFLFCDSRLSYGYFTRYARRRILCPSTEHQPEAFHDFFMDYLKKNPLDVLIPLTDYSAKYLSRHKSLLEQKAAFSIPDYDIFIRAYDKNNLMKLCREYGIPHPKSIDLSVPGYEAQVSGFQFPALIKPNRAAGARGFRKVNSFDEVRKLYPEIQKEFGNCHLQEFIPKGGRQLEAQLLMTGGKTVLSTINNQIRFYPVEGGSSCFNQTIQDDAIIEMCSRVLTILGWEGFADFDLIEDPRDGLIKIMEINPRLPACIKASVIAGVDFPVALAEHALNLPITRYDYTPGKYLRYFSLDLLWLYTSRKNPGVGREWIRKLFSRKQAFQDGDWRDPVPFIAGAFSGIAKQLNPKFRAKKQGMNT